MVSPYPNMTAKLKYKLPYLEGKVMMCHFVLYLTVKEVIVFTLTGLFTNKEKE